MGQSEKRRSKAVAAARALLKAAGFLLSVGPILAKLLSAEKFLLQVPRHFFLMSMEQCLTPASPPTCAPGRTWESSPADFLQLIS